jgi:hypothetical protein
MRHTIMSVIDDLFEKFDKGELRLSEKVVDVDGTDLSSDGTTGLQVTVDELVSLDSVVAVKMRTTTDNVFKTMIASTGADEIASAQSNVPDKGDNVVNVNFYSTDTSAGLSEHDAADDGALKEVKVIARGY